jgi:hypothetical protein
MEKLSPNGVDHSHKSVAAPELPVEVSSDALDPRLEPSGCFYLGEPPRENSFFSPGNPNRINPARSEENLKKVWVEKRKNRGLGVDSLPWTDPRRSFYG